MRANAPYCEAYVKFDYPHPETIDIHGTAAVKTLDLPFGWTAQEADAAKVIAFLEHPALVVIELYEDKTAIRSDPTAP